MEFSWIWCLDCDAKVVVAESDLWFPEYDQAYDDAFESVPETRESLQLYIIVRDFTPMEWTLL
jgi:hypothetical protein